MELLKYSKSSSSVYKQQNKTFTDIKYTNIIVQANGSVIDHAHMTSQSRPRLLKTYSMFRLFQAIVTKHPQQAIYLLLLYF